MARRDYRGRRGGGAAVASVTGAAVVSPRAAGTRPTEMAALGPARKRNGPYGARPLHPLAAGEPRTSAGARNCVILSVVCLNLLDAGLKPCPALVPAAD